MSATRELGRIADVLEALTAPERRERYRNPHDRDSRHDGHGKVPRRFDWSLALRAVPSLAERVRRVPGAGTAQAGEDDDGDFVLVNCPCGHHPVARAGFKRCPGCERHYGLLESRAYVVYGDMEPPG